MRRCGPGCSPASGTRTSTSCGRTAEAAGLSRQGTDALCRLGTLAGPWQEVLAAAEALALNAAMGAALEELRGLCQALEDQGQTDHWKLDLSLVNDMEYYNGLVLQGYLAGAAPGGAAGRAVRPPGGAVPPRRPGHRLRTVLRRAGPPLRRGRRRSRRAR